jgi:hypothetical protein
MKSIGRELGRILLIMLLLSMIGLLSLAGGSIPTDSRTAPGDSRVIAENEGPIFLTSAVTRVTLKPIAIENLKNYFTSQLPAGRRIYVVVEDLRVSDQPGVLYWLYLDLPSNQKPRGNKSEHVVGSLNFYNALGNDAGQAEIKNTRFFSYDITETLRKLRAQERFSDETTLTIIASGTPEANSNPRIGRIRVIER